ncbi:MAG: AtpZ/AtpI family protein [Acidobacteria bacterium]|nr:AtpZ/AtpI family protein [Acidobacteriota bacterium]
MGRPPNRWAMVGRYTTLAFTLPVSTFAGYLIGHLLDRLFRTDFLYVVFLLVGIAAGFVELIREAQKGAGEGGS